MAIAVNKEEEIESFSSAKNHSLSPNLEIPKVSQRLKTEVLVAAFGLINVLIANQIISLDYFTEIRADLRSFWAVLLSTFAVLLLLFCGGSIFSQAFKDLKRGFVSRNVSTGLALVILAAYAVSIGTTNFRLLATQPLVDSLVIVLFVVALDKYIFERFLVSVANNVGLRFGELFPEKNKIVSSLFEANNAIADNVPNLSNLTNSEFKVGMQVKVTSDDIIPCDMEIQTGSCEVRERKYSTRFQLRYKTESNTLFAGSKVVKGNAICTITSLPEESVLAYFIAVLNNRVNQETKLDTKESRKIETSYSLALIFIAACTALYWTDQQVSTGEIIRYSASVLLISLIPRWFEVRQYLRGLALSSGFSKGLLVKSVKALKKLINAKTLAIDYTNDFPPGEARLGNFELIDKRLEENSLALALATIYAATESIEYQTISDDFRKKAPQEKSFLNVSDVSVYPGLGICAKIEGADFTIGTEELLLERGVELQISEVGEPKGGQELFYVAIGRDPAARVYISRPFLRDGHDLSSSLNKLGVRAVLLSTGDQANLDKVAEDTGIELSNAYGNLDNQKFLTKLSSYAPCALFATERTPQDFVNCASVSLAVFDEIRWDIDRTDIIAFNRNIKFVSDAWRLAKAYNTVITLNAVLAIALSSLLIFLAIGGYLAPVVTALSSALAGIFMYSSVYLLFPSQSTKQL
ncbi:MAG: hypothetical protein KDD56_01640 [Bdellovibrionales bacterium]|nr:hypothetical protein [Bdellovibrionales bacterium]